MDAGRTDERAVFVAALEIKPAAERVAYLRQACRDDAALLRRVEALLEAHEKIGDFLEPPSLDPDIVREITPLTEEVGSIIGPYRLLELIGEGGFGAVYMAEQIEPVRRRVALKIIKLGMDTRRVIARFEAERQALAMMDHPNIARVLDAGATESGRPYFVMELVSGVSITDYCDRNELSVRRRLGLFVQVCDAVEHAHQKGIIHRDIKPSNVMVTLTDGAPVPKVIDFGIAKATERRLTDETSFTGGAHMIGTPAYMSPEQIKVGNPDIDTRTDIYSLGVLLYELLTGTTPFDTEQLRRAGYAEIQRIICEEEPALPSARLSATTKEPATVARQRGTSVDGLRRLIQGDLDWIVMKSLDKERVRRYTTASELAADIERHLRTEPVLAGPPSTVYRVKKFVRRRLALVTTAAAIIAAVVGGLIFSFAMFIQTDRALEREVVARGELQTVSDFLTNDLLASVYPEKAGGQEVTVRYILDAASANLDNSFEKSPLSEAAIRQALGSTYQKMGDYRAAESHLQRALEIRREQLGPDNPATLASLDGLGWLWWCAGRSEKAEPLLTEAFEARKRVLGPEHRETLESLTHLAWLDTRSASSAGETDLAEKAYQTGQRVLGQDDPITLGAAACLAMKCVARFRHSEAEAITPQAYELSRKVLGAEHETTLVLMNTLTWLHERQQRFDEGVEIGEQAYETALRVLGRTHMVTLHAMANLGALYTKQGRYEQADTILTQAFDLATRHLGQSHLITLCCGLKLSILYRAQSRHDEHDPLLMGLLETARRTYGERSVLAGYARYGLNVRKKQIAETIEQMKAAGDSEGAAAALRRLEEIDRVLEDKTARPAERKGY